jgi:hypothetical protein
VIAARWRALVILLVVTATSACGGAEDEPLAAVCEAAQAQAGPDAELVSAFSASGRVECTFGLPGPGEPMTCSDGRKVSVRQKQTVVVDADGAVTAGAREPMADLCGS